MEELNNAQERLLRFAHGFAGVLHVASAVVLIVLGLMEEGGTWKAALRVSYEIWEPNEDCEVGDNDIGRCFDLARGFHTRPLAIIWLLFLFGLWSGLVHFYTIAPGWNFFLKNFKMRWAPLRWVDYGVSSTLMIVVIAIYGGVDDVCVLIGVGLSQALTIFLGALSERSASNVLTAQDGGVRDVFQRAKWLLYAAANVVFVVGVWVPILVTFVSSIREIPDDAPVNYGLVFGIFSALAIVFSSFGFVFLAQILWTPKRNGYRYSYGVIEISYLVLSLISKVLLHWVLFFALFQRSASLTNSEYTPSNKLDLDSDLIYTVIGTVVPTGILAGVILIVLWSQQARVQSQNESTGAARSAPQVASKLSLKIL